jgi:CAAX protease family protein
MGLLRPEPWRRVLLIALGAATARIVLGEHLVLPLAERVWPAPVEAINEKELAGHPLVALEWLGLVWSFAACGEEIAYRGYLLTRAADLGARTPAACLAGIALVSVLFGVGHWYKGAVGVLDSAFAGLVPGGACLLARRNLWACILAHGFIDSFGVVAAYLGWES